MATDNTPPRLRLIATIAVIVIITLVSLDFVFKSYYAFMTDEAQREKLAPLTAKNEQVTSDKASFAGAKVPIDQAMAGLKGPRNELIEPKQSEDMAPMTGWAKLPKQPPLAAPMPAPHVDPAMAADGGAAMAEGGAAMAADGGAPMAADAGPTLKPKPAGKDGGH